MNRVLSNLKLQVESFYRSIKKHLKTNKERIVLDYGRDSKKVTIVCS